MVWLHGIDLDKHTNKLEGGMNKDLMKYFYLIYYSWRQVLVIFSNLAMAKEILTFSASLEFEKNVFPWHIQAENVGLGWYQA